MIENVRIATVNDFGVKLARNPCSSIGFFSGFLRLLKLELASN